MTPPKMNKATIMDSNDKQSMIVDEISDKQFKSMIIRIINAN
jgi:hypothetical protein